MTSTPTGYLVPCLSSGYGEPFPLLPEVRYTFGRAPHNRIALRDDLCSRDHAELFWHAGNWHLRDLKSMNGTHVNGQRLGKDQTLTSEDDIRFGTTRYRFLAHLDDLDDLPTNNPTPNAEPSEQKLAIRSRIGETKYLTPKGTAEHSLSPSRVPQPDAVAILYRLAIDMCTATTPQELAEIVLSAFFRATPAEVAAVLMVSDGQDPEMIAYRTRNEKQKTYHKISNFVSKEVVTTKQAVLAEDVASEKHLKNRDSVNELQAASLICAPILYENELLGLIHVYSTTQNRRLNGDDLEFTLAVARQVGIAWQHLRREAGLSAEVKSLRDKLNLESELVGQSSGIKQIESQISRVAAVKSTVLIRGESGVGKELVARGIHNSGNRKQSPFICLNCAALTETLLESELFGHEKGAFTGATDRMIGKFESADGGTIFLDEIGEMSLGTQAKLLRVLEGQSFERVGGNTPIRVDVRVLAATNRVLEEAVREGIFRKDLFFRLQVVQIDVLPLRERLDDIPLLAQHFFQHYSTETGRKLKSIAAAAIQKLSAYHWPGNVRELRNVIERAVVLCAGPHVEVADIWLSPLDANATGPSVPFTPCTLTEWEKLHILRTLDHTDWNKSKTAELLGIERSTLDRKLKTYGLKR
jgi:transcriptional regulator with GAF, ATPase, and Fis domain